MRHPSRAVLIWLLCLPVLIGGRVLHSQELPTDASNARVPVTDASTEVLAPDVRLVKLLGQLQTLHAEFSHQAGDGGTQTGEIWLRKPNLFRLETSPPLSQTIVSDGVSLWTHDRDLEQVIISPLDTRIEEMPILLFAGDPTLIPGSYHVELFEGEQTLHFLLTPLDKTNLITTLVLSFEDQHPVSISVENAMQERTVIKLSRVEELKGDAANLFTLEIPAYADVIDDRPG